MKFFKNLSICFLILASCLALSSNFALATETTVGSPVTIEFKLNTTESIAAGDYTIKYNANYLKYVSVSPADEGFVKVTEDGENSTIHALFTMQSDVKSIKVTFNVLQEVPADGIQVEFTPTEFSDMQSHIITGIQAATDTVTPKTINTYTVTFSYKDANGKEVVKEVPVDEGKRIDINEVPNTPNYKDRDGVEYTFDHWDVEFADMDITSDVVITAIYQEIRPQPSESPIPEEPGTTTPTDPDDTTPADPDDSGENLGDTNFVDDGYEGPLSPSTQQTGISIASAIAIALVALLGATFVIKRK